MSPSGTAKGQTDMFNRRRGFTLIEATMSIVITSILLVAMGAALAMTMNATDSGDDSNAAAAKASEALSQMNAELSVATTIQYPDSQHIALTVPDRDGDGAAELIEYRWSGRAGDPLLRAYKGSTPVAFIPGVQSFSAAHFDRPPAVPVESAEAILAQNNLPSGSSSSRLLKN
jgi:type II secretory pathway pseudopilin PulG